MPKSGTGANPDGDCTIPDSPKFFDLCNSAIQRAKARYGRTPSRDGKLKGRRLLSSTAHEGRDPYGELRSVPTW